MESQKQSRESLSSSQASRLKFEDQLRDVIMIQLDKLSQDGKEKALDYVNLLIDLEQKRLEFNRRQGLLYNWGGDEPSL